MTRPPLARNEFFVPLDCAALHGAEARYKSPGTRRYRKRQERIAMSHAEQAYEHADKAVHHWKLILAGSLSTAQRNYARLELIKAVGQRVRTRMALEQADAEQVAA